MLFLPLKLRSTPPEFQLIKTAIPFLSSVDALGLDWDTWFPGFPKSLYTNVKETYA
jgi:hypothetical protein